jgi:hypothetical protein
MVNTLISHLGSQIACDTTVPCKRTSGDLAADTYPGQYVVMDGSGTWSKIDSDTEAYRMAFGGVVDYRRRKNKSSGFPTIDEVWDIDNETTLADAPIITKGKVLVFIDDPVATYYPGKVLQASSTAGNLVITAALEATGATSGTAIRGQTLAILASKVVSGDTKAYVDLIDWSGK